MTPDDWERFFIEAGISTDSAKTHATKFADEKLTIESLQMLGCSMLTELGVTLMEALCILKQAKEATAQSTRILHSFFLVVAQGRMNGAPNEIRIYSWSFACLAC